MVDLFGDTMTASVPPTWRDVSQVRQVPDNQEVYQDCAEETGAVLVFEILERQGDVPDSDACSFFLEDLADANGASLEQKDAGSGEVVDILRDDEGRERLLSSFELPSSTEASRLCACIGRGSQRVVQGKGSAESDPHWIDVEICVLRIASVDTDLLITLSVPRKGDGQEARTGHSTVFREILMSFNVRDWSLFG